MNYKYITLLVLLLMSALPARAWRSIELSLADNQSYMINLSDTLSVSFTADDMLVDAGQYVLVLPLESIQHIDMSDNFTEAEAPTVPDDPITTSAGRPGEKPVFGLDGRRLLVPRSIGIADVRLINASGFETLLPISDCEVDLGALAPGIYIIAAGEYTFKFMLR